MYAQIGHMNAGFVSAQNLLFFNYNCSFFSFHTFNHFCLAQFPFVYLFHVASIRIHRPQSGSSTKGVESSLWFKGHLMRGGSGVGRSSREFQAAPCSVTLPPRAHAKAPRSVCALVSCPPDPQRRPVMAHRRPSPAACTQPNNVFK